MANPQTEEGYIALASEIVEQFCKYRISGEEWLVLWSVIRKTYGWKKKEDRIALSQFAVMTGLKRQTVLRAINKLSSKKIIAVIKNDDSGMNIYSFNKNFDQWSTLSKKITVSSKKIISVIKKDNLLSSKKIHTKETITKETIQKKGTEVIFPEWLPQETFKEYLLSRKKKLKPQSYPRFFKSLLKIARESNCTPEEILNQSIVNGWEGIFALKTGGTYGKNSGVNRISDGGLGIPKEYIPEPKVIPSDEEIKRTLANNKAFKQSAFGEN
jgi:phage replication O-like protein O